METKVTMAANPQGKGLVPILEDWQGAQPSVVRRRTPREVMRDYMVSSLVVAAEIRFKPRPGVDYFLYLADRQWRLSLISPDEWGGRQPGLCLGSCVLQTDMTWHLQPAAGVGECPELVEGLEVFQSGFFAWLDRDGALEDHLPFHVRQLPYYRRLLAAGMAASLKHSLERSGLGARRSREWLSEEKMPALPG
jgi:hypothetical protein